jgi:CMP-N-acetylneuraminic acid synthetase
VSTIGFIFARAGSKGLPGKNWRELLGKPLIQYSLDIAKQIPKVDDVFVSTDSALIAEIAEENGARVIERPTKLAGDNSPEWDAWTHAVEYVQQYFGFFDCFLSLPPTSPLRHVQDVKKVLQKFKIDNPDVCLTITPSSRNPAFNMVHLDPSGVPSLCLDAQGSFARRQDAPSVFDITTVAYAVRPSFIKKGNNLLSGDLAAIEVPKERAIDIDDIWDFIFAEAVMKRAYYAGE